VQVALADQEAFLAAVLFPVELEELSVGKAPVVGDQQIAAIAAFFLGQQAGVDLPGQIELTLGVGIDLGDDQMTDRGSPQTGMDPPLQGFEGAQTRLADVLPVTWANCSWSSCSWCCEPGAAGLAAGQLARPCRAGSPSDRHG
jgi:hypothetical protein